MPNVESYDPEALDEALANLAHHAQATRDALMMGDEAEAYMAYSAAITALAEATHQFSLRNAK